MNLKLTSGKILPVEMHKVKIVQSTFLQPAARRLEAMAEAGYNTFLLRSRDVFLDMLTDSGTNAMSDHQLAAMMQADDAYAGSESFYRLADAVKDVLGYQYTLPVHQGRAAENLLAKAFVKPGDVVIMNYHFTTTKAHFVLGGASVLELCTDEILNTASTVPFKGNMDLAKLEAAIAQHGPGKVSFVRMEATTNLVGGQPFSLQNLRDVKRIAAAHGILLVLDGSLLAENAYFIKQREAGCQGLSIQEIITLMMAEVDLFYMSGRKCASVRGGLMATNDPAHFKRLRDWLPLYEGFATYGGMSTKEVEAMAVGLREMTELNTAAASPEFIEYFVARLEGNGVPVVTPPGGLACHVDARKFASHLQPTQYIAGAVAAAIYLASGIRSMERGTISNDRDEHGKEVIADLELARLAVPRRTYTLSQIEYAVDRISWLYQHRELIGGLKFVEEPPVLRFFFGRLEPVGDWGQRIADAFVRDFGTDC